MDWDVIHEYLVDDYKDFSLSQISEKYWIDLDVLKEYFARDNIHEPIVSNTKLIRKKPAKKKIVKKFFFSVIHDELVEDLQSMSLRLVAEKHALGYKSLYQYCYRNNIEMPTRNAPRFTHPRFIQWDAIHDQLVEDLETMSIRQTAKKHGITSSALNKYCRRVKIGQKHRLKAKP